MDKKQATEALKKVKEISPKRKFNQSYDLVINLKGLDLKKPDHKVDFYLQLGHPTGKEIKVCALVGPELKESADSSCNETVLHDSFAKYKDKKAIKTLANSHDYFIAQANLMKDIASSFGRVFGPKGKMPNPKAGCVVPPNANLNALAEKLKKTVRLRVINDPVIRCLVGKEDMKDEEVLDNVMSIYDQVVHHLPSGKHNVKDICLKLSMGPVVKVGEKIEEAEKGKKSKSKPQAEEKPAEQPKEKAEA
jgi:large subunit ribosomal protein L1